MSILERRPLGVSRRVVSLFVLLPLLLSSPWGFPGTPLPSLDPRGKCGDCLWVAFGRTGRAMSRPKCAGRHRRGALASKSARSAPTGLPKWSPNHRNGLLGSLRIRRFLRNKQTCGETMISSTKLGFETLLGITRLSCHGFSKSFILV